MVTVVDCANLLKDYASSDFLRDRGETMGPEDERALVDLLVDQIEFADVIVLNKVSTASADDLAMARKIIKALNPVAKIIETDFANVPLDEVLDTELFNLEAAEQNPLWFKELNGFTDHVPETLEYGIRSFVYRARRPFNPACSISSSPKAGLEWCVPRVSSGWRRGQASSANSAKRGR